MTDNKSASKPEKQRSSTTSASGTNGNDELAKHMNASDYVNAVARKPAWHKFLLENNIAEGNLVSLVESDIYAQSLLAECNAKINNSMKEFDDQVAKNIFEGSDSLFPLFMQYLEDIKRYEDNKYLPRTNYKTLIDKTTALKSEIINRYEERLRLLKQKRTIVEAIVQYYKQRVRNYVHILNLDNVNKLVYDDEELFMVYTDLPEDNKRVFVDITFLQTLDLAIIKATEDVKNVSEKLNSTVDDVHDLWSKIKDSEEKLIKKNLESKE